MTISKTDKLTKLRIYLAVFPLLLLFQINNGFTEAINYNSQLEGKDLG